MTILRCRRQHTGPVPPRLLDHALRTRLEGADLTYPATLRADAAPPPSYRRLQRSRRLGAGDEVFERARDELLSWRMHERAGFVVATSTADLEVGTVLTLSTSFGPWAVVAPCRVVRVLADPDRVGFAYGTLSGHPVSGEEDFLIVRQPDDRVVATVRAVSRPDSTLARLGTPITRRQQRRIASDYLAALAGAV